MGFADKIKNLIMEEDPNDEAPVQAAPVVTPVTIGDRTGEPDPEMYANIKKAIEAARGKGPDYLSFLDAVAAMTSAGIDEVTAYKGSMATSKLGRERIIASANEYMKVVDGEKVKFANELEGTIGNDIKTLETAISNAETEIAELNAKLEKLTSDKIGNEKKKADLVTKRHSVTGQFEASAAKVADEFNVNIKKIMAYLPQ